MLDQSPYNQTAINNYMGSCQETPPSIMILTLMYCCNGTNNNWSQYTRRSKVIAGQFSLPSSETKVKVRKVTGQKAPKQVTWSRIRYGR